MKGDIYQHVRCDLEIIAYSDKCVDLIRIPAFAFLLCDKIYLKQKIL